MKRHCSFKIKDIQVVMLLVLCCNIHGFHGVRCLVYTNTVYCILMFQPASVGTNKNPVF